MAAFTSRGQRRHCLSRRVAAHRRVLAQGAAIQCEHLSLCIQHCAENRRTIRFASEFKLRRID